VTAGRRTSTLTPARLGGMLDQTGVRYKVVIVSACYSGVFIPRLAKVRKGRWLGLSNYWTAPPHIAEGQPRGVERCHLPRLEASATVRADRRGSVAYCNILQNAPNRHRAAWCASSWSGASRDSLMCPSSG
jgi:hypothetical protein